MLDEDYGKEKPEIVTSVPEVEVTKERKPYIAEKNGQLSHIGKLFKHKNRRGD